jgi:glycosyltransferase involved in cell wall biosynthesis
MPTKICFAYYWGTSGGVERVFLNRSEALLRRYPRLEIDIYFFQDRGGVALVRRYSKARGLSDRLRVIDTFDPSPYEAVFVVDTPQLPAGYPSVIGKMVMECHTPYAENRTWLQEWQARIDILLVPSSGFLRVIEDECPSLRGRVKVIRNFVPQLPPIDRSITLPAWCAPLFLYFSRVDEFKNFAEFVDGLALSREYLRREPLGIVSGQILGGYPFMEMIEKNDLRGSVAILPPVPFENSHVLMQMLRRKKAVFVSTSKGESFGLSAAEAMTAGLPVILSDIPPHAALVADRTKFLYPLGNARELARKMAAFEEQYDELSAECVELSRGFSEELFLTDWERVFGGDMKVMSGVA